MFLLVHLSFFPLRFPLLVSLLPSLISCVPFMFHLNMGNSFLLHFLLSLSTFHIFQLLFISSMFPLSGNMYMRGFIGSFYVCLPYCIRCWLHSLDQACQLVVCWCSHFWLSSWSVLSITPCPCIPTLSIMPLHILLSLQFYHCKS